MGFKTRQKYKRDKNHRTKVVGMYGNKPLSLRQFWRYIKNPTYAGIVQEKWNYDEPIMSKFEGIISIEDFVKSISIDPQYIDKLNKLVLDLWNEKHENVNQINKELDDKISALKGQGSLIARKITILSSETAIKYIEELLLNTQDPLKKAEYFGLIFEEAPTYAELVSRTPQIAPFLALNHAVEDALVPLGEPGCQVEPFS